MNPPDPLQLPETSEWDPSRTPGVSRGVRLWIALALGLAVVVWFVVTR